MDLKEFLLKIFNHRRAIGVQYGPPAYGRRSIFPICSLQGSGWYCPQSLRTQTVFPNTSSPDSQYYSITFNWNSFSFGGTYSYILCLLYSSIQFRNVPSRILFNTYSYILFPKISKAILKHTLKHCILDSCILIKRSQSLWEKCRKRSVLLQDKKQLL